jgi:hypothetical protein
MEPVGGSKYGVGKGRWTSYPKCTHGLGLWKEIRVK